MTGFCLTPLIVEHGATEFPDDTGTQTITFCKEPDAMSLLIYLVKFIERLIKRGHVESFSTVEIRCFNSRFLVVKTASFMQPLRVPNVTKLRTKKQRALSVLDDENAPHD